MASHPRKPRPLRLDRDNPSLRCRRPPVRSRRNCRSRNLEHIGVPSSKSCAPLLFPSSIISDRPETVRTLVSIVLTVTLRKTTGAEIWLIKWSSKSSRIPSLPRRHCRRTFWRPTLHPTLPPENIIRKPYEVRVPSDLPDSRSRPHPHNAPTRDPRLSFSFRSALIKVLNRSRKATHKGRPVAAGEFLPPCPRCLSLCLDAHFFLGSNDREWQI